MKTVSKEEFLKMVKENALDFDRDDIKLTDDLNELGIDSLGFITILYAIEDDYGIEADDSFFEKSNELNTIEDLVEAFKKLGLDIKV